MPDFSAKELFIDFIVENAHEFSLKLFYFIAFEWRWSNDAIQKKKKKNTRENESPFGGTKNNNFNVRLKYGRHWSELSSLFDTFCYELEINESPP